MRDRDFHYCAVYCGSTPGNLHPVSSPAHCCTSVASCSHYYNDHLRNNYLPWYVQPKNEEMFALLITIVSWSTITSGSSVISTPVTQTRTLTITSVITCHEGCPVPTAMPGPSGVAPISSHVPVPAPVSSFTPVPASSTPAGSPVPSKSGAAGSSKSIAPLATTSAQYNGASKFQMSMASILPAIAAVMALL